MTTDHPQQRCTETRPTMQHVIAPLDPDHLRAAQDLIEQVRVVTESTVRRAGSGDALGDEGPAPTGSSRP